MYSPVAEMKNSGSGTTRKNGAKTKSCAPKRISGAIASTSSSTPRNYSIAGKTPQQVQRRNERERRRVQAVNHGYEILAQQLADWDELKDKKLTKAQTLKAAILYIRHMQKLLNAPASSAGTTTPKTESFADYNFDDAEFGVDPSVLMAEAGEGIRLSPTESGYSTTAAGECRLSAGSYGSTVTPSVPESGSPLGLYSQSPSGDAFSIENCTVSSPQYAAVNEFSMSSWSHPHHYHTTHLQQQQFHYSNENNENGDFTNNYPLNAGYATHAARQSEGNCAQYPCFLPQRSYHSV